MTSKELKERLAKTPNKHNLYCFNEGQIKEIIQDLEKLEILQDFINNFLDFRLVYDDIDWYEIIPKEQYLSNCGCRILTEEKYKKIKEAVEK